MQVHIMTTEWQHDKRKLFSIVCVVYMVVAERLSVRYLILLHSLFACMYVCMYVCTCMYIRYTLIAWAMYALRILAKSPR
jgi:hypothetical protein